MSRSYIHTETYSREQTIQLSDADTRRNGDCELDLSLLYPPITSKDLGRENYGKAWFDPDDTDFIVDTAQWRSPQESDTFHRHLVGVAGEAGWSALTRAPFDCRILPDYEGDNGWDVEVPCQFRSDPLRTEVKTTQKWENPERVISRHEIDQADCFVLCRTDAPRRYVEIVGYIERPLLKLIGETYGRDGYLLTPEYLRPIGPVEIESGTLTEVMENAKKSSCSTGRK